MKKLKDLFISFICSLFISWVVGFILTFFCRLDGMTETKAGIILGIVFLMFIGIWITLYKALKDE